MIEWLLILGFSNTCFALLLAMAALLVSRKFNKPQLAHFLWLMVFIKLVTPPLLTVPGMDWVQTIAAEPPTESASLPIADLDWSETTSMQSSPAVPPVTPNLWHSISVTNALAQWTVGYSSQLAAPWLILGWILGSALLLLLSLFRGYRFNRLIHQYSQACPSSIDSEARIIAQRLKLQRLPQIKITSAKLSPLVWWFGGRTTVVLPEWMLENMDRKNWTWVLAHELAHVKRRDHWVRWLEWFACVLFWWNPIVWWAQRNLRISEEICCDALVLSSTNEAPKTYANSILEAVEFLAGSALRPPAMASEINSGGVLERRFKMMIGNREKQKSSLGVRVIVAFIALLVLPLGFASAQDFEAIAKRLKKAVKKGEITETQAEAMLSALKKSNPKKKKNQSSSSRQRVGEKRFEMVVKEIKQAVEDGKMTPEQAHEKIMEIKERIFGDQNQNEEAHSMREREEKYRSIAEEIKKAVGAGKLNKKDAERKLLALRKELFEKPRGQKERNEIKDREKEFHAIAEKLKKAVEAGMLSKEDAEKKLHALRKELFGHQEKKAAGNDMREREEKYHAIAEEIKKAVEAGKLSREDAHRKMQEVRKKLFEKSGNREQERRRAGESEHHPDRSRETDFDVIRKRIEKEVKAGRMSKENAARALEEVKRRLDFRAKDGDVEEIDPATMKRIEEFKKRIEDGVKSGRLSKEQAAEAMEGMKWRMELSLKKRAMEREKKKDAEHKRKPTRLDLKSIELKIKEKVESGQISEEQAAETLESIRRRMEKESRVRRGDDG